MYLSKVWLAPKQLDNAWQWHRAIWTLFPGIERKENESSPFRFLVEDLELSKGAQLLMLSSIEPQLLSDRAKILAKKEYSPILAEGLKLGFTLCANVTKVIHEQGEKGRRIRVPLIQEEQQQVWLDRKLDGIAKVDWSGTQIRPLKPLYFLRGKQPGKIVPVQYEGQLQVQAPEKFMAVLQKGLGPAKAFGCGLMLIRRL